MSCLFMGNCETVICNKMLFSFGKRILSEWGLSTPNLFPSWNYIGWVRRAECVTWCNGFVRTWLRFVLSLANCNRRKTNGYLINGQSAVRFMACRLMALYTGIEISRRACNDMSPVVSAGKITWARPLKFYSRVPFHRKCKSRQHNELWVMIWETAANILWHEFPYGP